MTTAHAPTYDLPGSLFLILTGQTDNGKSYQFRRAVRAVVPHTTRPAVAPTLLLMGEASGEGTLGDLLADPSTCLPWGVTTCDEGIEVLRIVFPEGRAPLSLGEARKVWHERLVTKAGKKGASGVPPLVTTPNDHMLIRSVGVDSITSLHLGQMNWVRDTANAAATARGVSGVTLDNDRKRQAGLAAGPAESLVNMLSGLTQRHRGILIVVACHTRPQVQVSIIGANAEGKGGEKVETVVGEAPDFGAPKAVQAGVYATGYSALWQHLAAKANAIWHMYGVVPDMRLVSAAEMNTARPNGGVRFGAVTARGDYPGLGSVKWVKRQAPGDGAAWTLWLDQAPGIWHPDVPWSDAETFRGELLKLGPVHAKKYEDPHHGRGPDLGAVLEMCIAQGLAGKAGAA